MHRFAIRTLAVLLALGLPLRAGGTRPVIRYAIFPAPPFMIGAATEGEAVTGIDVEIVGELAWT
jgi:hypothetical protein